MCRIEVVSNIYYNINRSITDDRMDNNDEIVTMTDIRNDDNDNAN